MSDASRPTLWQVSPWLTALAASLVIFFPIEKITPALIAWLTLLAGCAAALGCRRPGWSGAALLWGAVTLLMGCIFFSDPPSAGGWCALRALALGQQLALALLLSWRRQPSSFGLGLRLLGLVGPMLLTLRLAPFDFTTIDQVAILALDLVALPLWIASTAVAAPRNDEAWVRSDPAVGKGLHPNAIDGEGPEPPSPAASPSG